MVPAGSTVFPRMARQYLHGDERDKASAEFVEQVSRIELPPKLHKCCHVEARWDNQAGRFSTEVRILHVSWASPFTAQCFACKAIDYA